MTCAWRLSLAAALLLAGCAEQPKVTEYLDPQTAVTIRALATPIIYAHDAPELAANSRDYLSLGLVEVNNMGARKHYLVLVSWTTVYRQRMGVAPAPIAERIEVDSGGKTLAFRNPSHESRSLGVGGPLFRPPIGYVGESWYTVTPADLRKLAAAPVDSISLDEEAGRTVYVPWERPSESLAEFVRDIPDTVIVEPQRR